MTITERLKLAGSEPILGALFVAILLYIVYLTTFALQLQRRLDQIDTKMAAHTWCGDPVVRKP